MSLTLRLHAGDFAVCRLDPAAPVPAWTQGEGFTSITRSTTELSIIRPASCVPADVKQERGWRLLELVGPFPFEAVGILASVLTPLAHARVSVLAVATFDTDYVLVKAAALPAASEVLRAHGHTLAG